MEPLTPSTGVTTGRPAAETGLVSRVLVYLRPYRWQYAAALCCMVLFGASDGVVPFLIKHVLDGVFAQHDRSMLMLLPLVLVIFALVRAVADFGQEFLMARIGHRVVRDIRNQFNSQLLKLAPDFFLRTSSAKLVSTVTSDVLLVRMLLTESSAAVIRDVIRVVALLISALYLDPVLAGIAVLAFPIGVWPVYRFGRRLRKLSKQGQEEIGMLAALLNEAVLGNRVVKLFGREAYEQDRFEQENEKLTKTFVRSEKLRALTGPINEALASCAIAAVVLYGGFSVMNGFRSQGEFIAFLIAVFLLYDPFKKLSRVSSVVQQGLAGAQRIFEVLDTQPSVNESEHPLLLGADNTIRFENVAFRYRDLTNVNANNDRPAALEDISLEIPQGKKIAIVGFSGAGKTTLVDLIPRFMDPSSGKITIGGVDIAKVSLSSLRERIAMVSQHTFLFNDTVYNNIAYGRPGADKQAIIESARAAHAFDFISQLPHGFDTLLGEAGLSLSGGERQRLAIARAILKDAPILILDEATASLDNRSEREVQQALELLLRGRTAIIIAHRLSTVRNADVIVVMRNGRIVEEGSHEKLLALGGEYAKLHALQFAAVEPREEAGAPTLN